VDNSKICMFEYSLICLQPTQIYTNIAPFTNHFLNYSPLYSQSVKVISPKYSYENLAQ